MLRKVILFKPSVARVKLGKFPRAKRVGKVKKCSYTLTSDIRSAGKRLRRCSGPRRVVLASCSPTVGLVFRSAFATWRQRHGLKTSQPEVNRIHSRLYAAAGLRKGKRGPRRKMRTSQDEPPGQQDSQQSDAGQQQTQGAVAQAAEVGQSPHHEGSSLTATTAPSVTRAPVSQQDQQQQQQDGQQEQGPVAQGAGSRRVTFATPLQEGSSHNSATAPSVSVTTPRHNTSASLLARAGKGRRVTGRGLMATMRRSALAMARALTAQPHDHTHGPLEGCYTTQQATAPSGQHNVTSSTPEERVHDGTCVSGQEVNPPMILPTEQARHSPNQPAQQSTSPETLPSEQERHSDASPTILPSEQGRHNGQDGPEEEGCSDNTTTAPSGHIEASPTILPSEQGRHHRSRQTSVCADRHPPVKGGKKGGGGRAGKKVAAPSTQRLTPY